jgi:hypothetical protein
MAAVAHPDPSRSLARNRLDLILPHRLKRHDNLD